MSDDITFCLDDEHCRYRNDCFRDSKKIIEPFRPHSYAHLSGEEGCPFRNFMVDVRREEK